MREHKTKTEASERGPFLLPMKKRIGIQGYKGSYHEQAAKHYFGKEIDVVPARTFQDLVRMGEDAGQTDGAIMAIENSIAGSIIQNYTLLLESHLKVVGEIYLRINHQLMALPGTTIGQLAEVHSHHMAIHQCRKFFHDYPEIHLVETADTALSAQEIKEKKLANVGAIAGKQAAELYGLQILAAGIETVKNNYTRFLILSREEVLNGHVPNKASLHFRVSHNPGSLMKALATIAEHGLNVSKIQSFPVIEEEWRYYFHCDVEFTQRDAFDRALDGLKRATEMLRVLGIYQKGETIV